MEDRRGDIALGQNCKCVLLSIPHKCENVSNPLSINNK